MSQNGFTLKSTGMSLHFEIIEMCSGLVDTTLITWFEFSRSNNVLRQGIHLHLATQVK